MTGSTSLALPDARVPLKDGIPLSERHNETFQDLVSSLGGQKAKAMLGMTAEFDQGEFRKDCERLRKRMRDQTLGLLQPRGIFIQYWDMVTGMALLYTLFVTTFEVGLDIPTKIDGLFVANQIVALLFLSDICVQFFLPVPDPSKGEGSFERRHVVLAKKYLKGWFMLDVVTIIPFDVLVYASVLTGPVKGTKLLRIMRLIKLLKVLKGSAIIERWQSQIAISSSKQMLLTYSFITIVLLHWFACGWCLLPVLQGSQRGEKGSAEQLALQAAVELRMDVATASGEACTACLHNDPSTQALCDYPCLTPCELETLATSLSVPLTYVANHEVWTCRAVDAGHFKPTAILAGAAPADLYVTALLVAMLQMVGGVSTVLPQNVGEFAWFAVTILAGTVLFAAVQGVICGIVTTGDPDEIAWRQNYDALNFMMADCNLPLDDRVAVRKFFRKSRRLFKRRSYVGLIDNCLSPELKDDVRYAISESLFQTVWYLKECDREFLEELAAYIQRLAYSPKEDIDAESHLNILTVGMATRGTVMINAGMAFGDIILTSKTLRDTTPAHTMIYCEAARLSRDDLEEALKEYPDAQAVIRRASIKLALNRAMVIISLHVQMRRMRQNGITSFRTPPISPDRDLAAGGKQPMLMAGKDLPPPPPIPVTVLDADLPTRPSGPSVASSGRDSPSPAASGSSPGPTLTNSSRTKPSELGVATELRELHALLGTDWKELEYDGDGKPVEILLPSKTGLGKEADATVHRISNAPPKQQAALLATLMLSTQAKVDRLAEAFATGLPHPGRRDLSA